MNRPNLFTYATSELSQDAFLCWLLQHIQYEQKQKIGYQIAVNLLQMIIEKHQEFDLGAKKDIEIDEYTIEIVTQFQKIDILLTLTSKVTGHKHWIIIEDKTNSAETGKGQLERYKKALHVQFESEYDDTQSSVLLVFFKSGFESNQKKEQLEERDIVFIGYEEVFQLFSPHEHAIREDVIVSDWWDYFLMTHYQPIIAAQKDQIDPEKTIKEVYMEVFQHGPERIFFEKVTDYLFDNDPAFKIKIHSIQGKGHMDWHCALSKKAWDNKYTDVTIAMYCIWNPQQFTINVKVSANDYQPRKKMSDRIEENFLKQRDLIKNSLRHVQQRLNHWKIRHHFLQILQMKDVQNVPLKQVKQQLAQDITLIANQIEQALCEIDSEHRIIAQQGDARFLVYVGNEQGSILDLTENILYPAQYAHSILKRGYWDNYEGNHDLVELLKTVRVVDKF